MSGGSTQCANCAYEMERPTLVVDGKSFCCSGCAQGGPCICSYSRVPGGAALNIDENAVFDSDAAYDPDSPYSSVFVRMVDNVLKEVEITQQAIKDRQGPVKDLLDLLQRTARLLQIMTYRLEEQTLGHKSQTPEWVSRIQSDVAAREPEETVRLFVQGLADQDMVFCYARALGKLPSVAGLKLVNVNNSDVCYQVQTSSKAKLAREVMSLPDFRPLRAHSTPDEITVMLGQDGAVDHHPSGPSGPSSAAPHQPQPQHPVDPASARVGTDRTGFIEVGLDGFFNARHYLVEDGEPGPVAMKSWRVEISLEGDRVNAAGQLEGMDRVQKTIEGLLSTYNNKLLNNIPPYDQIQPTPENIARTLYNQISAEISDEYLRVKGLKVWVNPTQYVWYSESSGNAA